MSLQTTATRTPVRPLRRGRRQNSETADPSSAQTRLGPIEFCHDHIRAGEFINVSTYLVAESLSHELCAGPAACRARAFGRAPPSAGRGKVPKRPHLCDDT
ncbi:hypothetical protein EVAR_31802_1 [Eumeta japonica]|uniref:Uncharacterized protein n=1 Tax=Eumeta variegata TaxID=151549 RepID=A0A4C1W6Y3_EUMVA|nr:hypothetical protein EVAR_31802_1 [Eumeta japonica]